MAAYPCHALRLRNVRDLDQSARSALERVVGHQLRESLRLVIQVVNAGVEEPAARTADDELPAWSDVYEGLSDRRPAVRFWILGVVQNRVARECVKQLAASCHDPGQLA